MKEKSSLYCHECGSTFTGEFDLSLNGNHVVNCPKCKHEHCRVIRDGKVTGDRWDQRNGPTYNIIVTGTTTSSSSSYQSSGTGGYLMDSWTNTSTSTGTISYYILR